MHLSRCSHSRCAHSRCSHSPSRRPRLIKMLALSSLVFTAMLLSSPAAYASHWKVSVTDSGGSQTTAVITGIPGFDPGQNVTTPWTPPADGNNSTSFNLGSDVLLTAGDASGSCSATVNAKITFIWVADPAGDPAPTQVWIVETAAATAYAIGTGATSQASDGLPGDTYVKDPPGYHLDGGSMVTPSGLPGGGRLTKLTVSNGSVSFNHALSASSSSGESQSDAVDDQDNAYLSYTLTIHPQPYNFHQTLGQDNGDGTISFQYAWLSTSGGRITDLTSCYLHERVTYPGGNPYYPPLPFVVAPPGTPNPTVAPGALKNGILMTSTATNGDTHSPWPLSTNYSDFTSLTVSAAQRYEFDDIATGDTNLLVPGPDSTQTITRIIYPVGAPPSPDWWYKVTKNGVPSTKEVMPHP